jgi:hypothetical protein
VTGFAYKSICKVNMRNSHNFGYVDNKEELLSTFLHFSYLKSGKKAVYCDLQGVKTEKNYMLTDPAVNSYS